MALVKLPHFGTIDSTSLEQYYDTQAPYGPSEISIDLNFGEKTIDPKNLETVKEFIDNIRIHDLNNRKFIEKDYRDPEGETVRLYIEHHLEELGENELSSLVDLNSKSTEHGKQLLKSLQLTRVGIYPEGEDQFAIFDYSIGKEITDYLVVISTDENGNVIFMTMES